ncbi:MAG TPA: hypothetical protein VK968_13425, partial [Roseimicrobium sp.]|nr:hypothetical protein [Roseimicrobium sp.]
MPKQTADVDGRHGRPIHPRLQIMQGKKSEIDLPSHVRTIASVRGFAGLKQIRRWINRARTGMANAFDSNALRHRLRGTPERRIRKASTNATRSLA